MLFQTGRRLRVALRRKRPRPRRLRVLVGALHAALFAASERLATLRARRAASFSMPSSREAARMPLSGRPSPSRPLALSFGSTSGETPFAFNSVRVIHSASSVSRSRAARSARSILRKIFRPQVLNYLIRPATSRCRDCPYLARRTSPSHPPQASQWRCLFLGYRS